MTTFSSLSIFLLLSIGIAFAAPNEIPCPSDLGNVVCYRIMVPIDHANPDTSAKIPILYGINKPTIPFSLEAAIGAIPGGPGGSLLDLGQSLQPFISAEYANQVKRPVVLIDPRGTGNASVITCKKENANNTDLTTLASRLEGIQTCLEQIGPSLVHYSTKAVINDMEIIRETIGLKQFDLYSVSYGAFVGQAYSLIRPDSIRSMLLDSPLPLQRDLYGVKKYEGSKRIYKLKSANNTKFNLDELNENIETVLTRLRSSRELQQSLSIVPQDIYTMYTFYSDGFIKAIGDAAKEDYTALQELNEQISLPAFSRDPLPVTIATFCNDLVNYVPWPPAASFVERLISLTENVIIQVTPSTFAPFTISEAFSPVSFCIVFPFEQLPEEGIPKELPKQKDIPALVPFGEVDQVYPLELSELLDPVLQSKVAIIKGAPHDILAQDNKCARKLLVSFLITGKVSDFSACA